MTDNAHILIWAAHENVQSRTRTARTTRDARVTAGTHCGVTTVASEAVREDNFVGRLASINQA